MQMHTNACNFAYVQIQSEERRIVVNCSINDIAACLGLSRNTVSKALNGKPGVSEETRKKIIETAVEMKYRQFLSADDLKEETKRTGSIILLTKSTAQTGFWLNVMEGIKSAIHGTGFSLAMAIVTDDEIASYRIPPILQQSDVRGIILVEVCNAEMCRKLLTLNIPIVTVDYPQHADDLMDKLDVVTMENKKNIRTLITRLYSNGKRRFAFAGNLISENTSQGFADRYQAFSDTLREYGLREMKDCSLTEIAQDSFMNLSSLVSMIKNFKELPEVYICGNDWTAIQMMHALREAGVRIPEDVAIAGFDDIAEASETLPSLTTIRTPKELLGEETMHCLLSKIMTPSRPSLYITAATELITRDSTGGLN